MDAINSSENIEVTPQMIEAGYAALATACVVDDLSEADKLVVVRIYRAMRQCELSPVRSASVR